MAKYDLYQHIDAKTENFLSRLEGVRNTGLNKWMAKCTVHPDRSASLGIKQLDDKIIFNCFAGCDKQSILSAVGLKFEDLFPDKVGYEKKPIPRFSRSEFFDIAMNEAGILALAVGMLLNGDDICEKNLERVRIAIEKIASMNLEVRKNNGKH